MTHSRSPRISFGQLVSKFSFTFVSTLLIVSHSAYATPQTWTGATAGIWGTSSNWNPNGTPTSTTDATIAGPGGVSGSTLTININSASQANSITFTNSSSTTLSNTTSLSNQTLSVGGGGITTGSGAVTIGSATANQNVNVALGASETWAVGTGGLTVDNVISDGGNGYGLTLAGTNSGGGTLTLAGANTYTGLTTIDNGTLAISATGSLQSGNNVTFGSNGALTVTGKTGGSTQTLGTLTSNGGAATVTSTFGTVGTTLAIGTYTRTAGATTNFTTSGGTNGTTNKITLGNITANTFIDQGTFFGGSSYAFYDTNGYVRALSYTGDATAAHASTLTGVQTSLGTTTSASNVQYVGTATGSSSTTSTTGNPGSAQFVVASVTPYTVGEAIADTTSGSGEVYITAINASTKTLTLSGRISASATPGDTLTPYNAVSAQGTASIDTLNLSGPGAGIIQTAGTTLTLNGVLRSGETSHAAGVISGGTLKAGGTDLVLDTATSTDNLVIGSAINNNGVPLVISGLGVTTLQGVISGNGDLVVSNSNAVSISGANTYSGGTIINAGTVSVSNSTALGASTGQVTLGTGGASASISANGVTVNNPILVNAGGSRTLTDASSAGTFGGGVTLQDGVTLTVKNTSPTLTLSGGITGTGNLVLTSDTGARGNDNITTHSVNNVGTITYTGLATGSTISSTIGSNVTGLIVNLASGVAVSLSGSNTTFDGDTTLTSGVLNLQNSAALQDSVLVTNSTAGSVTFGTSTTVGLSAASVGGLAGSGNINLNNTLTTPTAVALTVGNSNTANGSATNPNTLNPTYSGVLSNTNGNASVDKVGSNTQTFTGPNTYSGGTTVSAGTLYSNNTSGSGTGTGNVMVSGGASFGGNGIIKPSSGNGITLSGSGTTPTTYATLISGGAQSVGVTTAGAGNSANKGLTLDNTAAAGTGTILNASLGTANLTFYLGAGNISSHAQDFSNPNENSTYMTVLGSAPTASAYEALINGNLNGQIAFATGDTITVDDLTGTNNLQLKLGIPYLLIQAGGGTSVDDNDFYTGLVTSGGVKDGILQNGWVENLTVAGTAAQENYATRLYLYDGNLEVVPEPATWAMMLGGLASLLVWQRRRKNLAGVAHPRLTGGGQGLKDQGFQS